MVYITILISILNIYVYNYKSFFKEKIYINFSTAIAIVYIISIFWSENWLEGMKFMQNKIVLLIIPILLLPTTVPNRRKIITYFSYSLLLSTGIIFFLNNLSDTILVNLTNKFSNILNPYIPYNKELFGIYSPFIERIQWGNLLGIAWILNFYMVLQQKKIRQIFILLLLTMIILYSGSRGTWVGILAVIVTSIILLPSSLKIKMTYTILFVSVLVIIYKLPSVHKRILQAKYEYKMVFQENNTKDIENYSSIRRWISWQNSFLLIKKNKILGTGIGDYKSSYYNIYRSQPQYNLPVNNHSQWLHILGSTGIVGCISVIIGLLIGLVYSKQKKLYIMISVFYSTVFIFDAILLQTTDCILFALMYSALLYDHKPEHTTP